MNQKITKRQAQILKILIEQYLICSKPISSSKIANLFLPRYSSATIRNEAVVLHKFGFLIKESFNKASIPTTKGYRYYIDHLGTKFDNEKLRAEINLIFQKKDLGIEFAINDALNCISEITHLTILVSENDFSNVYLKKIVVTKINYLNALINVIFSNEIERSKIINYQNYCFEDLKTFVNLLNLFITKIPINQLIKRIGQIKPILISEIQHCNYLIKKFINIIFNTLKIKKQTYGLKYLFSNFKNTNLTTIKNIFAFIEEFSPFNFFETMVSKSKNDKINVKIGQEIGNSQLDNISLVATKYKMFNDKEKQMVVLGPKNMKYLDVLCLLKYVREEIKNYQKKIKPTLKYE